MREEIERITAIFDRKHTPYWAVYSTKGATELKEDSLQTVEGKQERKQTYDASRNFFVETLEWLRNGTYKVYFFSNIEQLKKKLENPELAIGQVENFKICASASETPDQPAQAPTIPQIGSLFGEDEVEKRASARFERMELQWQLKLSEKDNEALKKENTELRAKVAKLEQELESDKTSKFLAIYEDFKPLIQKSFGTAKRVARPVQKIARPAAISGTEEQINNANNTANDNSEMNNEEREREIIEKIKEIEPNDYLTLLEGIVKLYHNDPDTYKFARRFLI